MDALILRVALLLCQPVSAVSAMRATDVLCVAVAASERDVSRGHTRTLAAIEMGYIVNAAVCEPDRLKEMDTAARTRAGLVAVTASESVTEAMFAAMPLEP